MSMPAPNIDPTLIDALSISLEELQPASQELLLLIREQVLENHKEGKPATVYISEPAPEHLEEVRNRLACACVTVIDGKDKSNNYFLHLYVSRASTALVVAQEHPPVRDRQYIPPSSLLQAIAELLAAPLLLMNTLVLWSVGKLPQATTASPPASQDTPTFIPDATTTLNQQLLHQETEKAAKAREEERQLNEALQLLPGRLIEKIKKSQTNPDQRVVLVDAPSEHPLHFYIPVKEHSTDPLWNRNGWQTLVGSQRRLDITLTPEADADLHDAHRRAVRVLREQFIPRGFRVYVRDRLSPGVGCYWREILLSWVKLP